MTISHEEHARPDALRPAIRRGAWTGPTAGLAPGAAQANLVVLPEADALDFLRFCVHNPMPCPVLEVTEPGSPEPVHTAPGADLRTDLPRYRVYRSGALHEEPADVVEHWRDDLVAFLLGCSFTFERALLAAGLPGRHLEKRGTGPPKPGRAATSSSSSTSRCTARRSNAGRRGGSPARSSSRCDPCAPTRRSAPRRSPPASCARTARRSTSAIPTRSASPTSTAPTTATRSRCARARCRCSRRAASRRRRRLSGAGPS